MGSIFGGKVEGTLNPKPVREFCFERLGGFEHPTGLGLERTRCFVMVHGMNGVSLDA